MEVFSPQPVQKYEIRGLQDRSILFFRRKASCEP